MKIAVPQPVVDDYAKVQFATEVAFTALVKQAKDSGLNVSTAMGLMYLTTQELTRNFQEACRAILTALTIPKPMKDSEL